jgi:hypothetical protein
MKLSTSLQKFAPQRKAVAAVFALSGEATSSCGASLAAMLLLAVATLGQQQTAPSKQATPSSTTQTQPPAQQPAPLFGGQIGTKSSKSTKESATLGFNGIDPSGKVDKRMLGVTPAAKDVAQVANMDSTHPTRAELTAFVKQGGLKSK